MKKMAQKLTFSSLRILNSKTNATYDPRFYTRQLNQYSPFYKSIIQIEDGPALGIQRIEDEWPLSIPHTVSPVQYWAVERFYALCFYEFVNYDYDFMFNNQIRQIYFYSY